MKWCGKEYKNLTIEDAIGSYEDGFELVCGDGCVKNIHHRFDGFYSLMFGIDVCQNYRKKEETND